MKVAALLTLLLLFFGAGRSLALEIEIDFFDLRPIQSPTIHLKLSGAIEEGDTMRVAEEMLKYDLNAMRDILVILNSPGGNLAEGLALGRFFAGMDDLVVSTQVGSLEDEIKICASACVFVYLGGDYRYLSKDARIGVHRFSWADEQTNRNAHEALADAQVISGEIVSYITEQRAAPEFFDRMSSTASEGVDWVPEELLRDWRVVTGRIYDETSEYVNIDGALALKLEQVATFGTNSLVLACGANGLVVSALLQEPEATTIGHFELVIDGNGFEPKDWEVIERKNYLSHVLATIPNDLGRLMTGAKTFGARIVVPTGTVFYGFEQTLRDNKLSEMIAGCQPSRAPEPKAMIVYRDTDFVGRDLTPSGLKGISFEQCKEICLTTRTCSAVSYVISKQWCWPKSSGADSKSSPGILSAVKSVN